MSSDNPYQGSLPVQENRGSLVQREVWVVWPTVNLVNSRRIIPLWHSMGYRVAVMVEKRIEGEASAMGADKILVQDSWQGFPKAVNLLLKSVPGRVVVVAGDDIHPDLNRRACVIARDFIERFPDSFGVMQPIGDHYGSYDICCISPWIGRAFIERAYGGAGPYWPGYYHYFSDHELQQYAAAQGVFLQREDLSQYHDHWERNRIARPQYLMKALHRWREDHDLYTVRQHKGFPNE